jgi:NitT/TauT family transport system substrate-binding protein
VGSPVSALTALRSGQVDALMHMDPLMLQLELRGEASILVDLRSPQMAQAALGMSLPSSCLAASSDFFQRFPGTAQAASDAMVQSLQWLQQASLRDVLRLLPENLPTHQSGMDAQLFVASFERLRSAFSTDGICQPAWAAQLLQAMYEVDPALRLALIDPQRSINPDLALRSKLRLKTSAPTT